MDQAAVMPATKSLRQRLEQRFSEWHGTLVFLALDPFMARPLLDFIKPRRSLVICWDDGFAANTLRGHGVEVMAVGQSLGGRRASDRLLDAPDVKARLLYAVRQGPVGVLAFKGSARLVTAIQSLGFPPEQLKYLAPSVAVSRSFENKLKFHEKVAGFEVPLPDFEILKPQTGPSFDQLKERYGLPFVAQKGASYSGAGTFLIANEADWQAATAGREKRPLKVSRMIHGVPYTLNACVLRSEVVVGSVIEQLTGIPELTPYKLGSCGNIWNPEGLSEAALESLRAATREVGRALQSHGYLGHYGVDLVLDGHDRATVIECNPRFTATLPVDSALSMERGEAPLAALHCLAHLGLHEAAEALAERSQGPARTQWILRHQGPPVVSMGGRWSLVNEAWTRVEARFRAFEEFFEKPDQGLWIQGAQGRTLEDGTESARLVLKGHRHPRDEAALLSRFSDAGGGSEASRAA